MAIITLDRDGALDAPVALATIPHTSDNENRRVVITNTSGSAIVLDLSSPSNELLFSVVPNGELSVADENGLLKAQSATVRINGGSHAVLVATNTGATDHTVDAAIGSGSTHGTSSTDGDRVYAEIISA